MTINRSSETVREAENLRHLIDVAPSFFVFLAPSGEITDVNARALVVLAGCKAKIVGLSIWGIDSWVLTPESVERLKVGVRDAAAGITTKFVLRYLASESGHGEFRRLAVVMTPFMNLEKNVFRIAATGVDVPDQEDLDRNVDPVVDADDASYEDGSKRCILAEMSHEIRAPLSVIMGYAKLLGGPSLSEGERNHYSAVVRDNCRYLLTLIDDVLQVAKKDGGTLMIRSERIHLPRFLADIAASLRLNAQAKGLSLVFSSRRLIPEWITSDATALRQILFNVIGNAIKFSSDGEIKILVVFDDPLLEKSTSSLRFIIDDHGIGIAPDQQSKIFQPFFQVDDKSSRNQHGAGLGLDLSRRLATLLGGNVILGQSVLGHGSSFEVAIDPSPAFGSVLLDARPDDFASSDTATAKCLLNGRRILAVDDVAENRELIEIILMKSGATVDAAENGHEAIIKASAIDYDVILMDMEMPQVNGVNSRLKPTVIALQSAKPWIMPLRQHR